jgi:hypothetical protein
MKKKISHWKEMGGFVQIGIDSVTCLVALSEQNLSAWKIMGFLLRETNSHNLVRVTYEDLARATGRCRATVAKSLKLLEQYAFIRREGRLIRVNASVSWKNARHPKDPTVKAWLSPLKIDASAERKFRSYKISKEIRVA